MAVRSLVLGLALAGAACCPEPQVAPAPAPALGTTDAKEDIAPEAATGYARRDAVAARGAMVAAAHPHASAAGLAMLEQGGSATDAAVAMAVMLTLVEPQSSGIGGGAFLLRYDAQAKAVSSWDGRETAPAAATPDMFLDRAGKPRKFFDAVIGGLSVGVPGQLRMLETIHREHGKLPWAKLFAPAIELAERGFALSPRLFDLLKRDPILPTVAGARDYFYLPSGAPKPVGTVLKNPALAEVLRTVATEGANAFYTGALADDIVAATAKAPKNPGRLRKTDMAAYRPKKRGSACLTYRQKYRVCGMPPPSSGGITTLQILGLLERFDVPQMDPNGVPVAHLFAEAGRLAFADRNRYIADPDFISVPQAGLLDRAYLASRSQLIDPKRAQSGEVTPGDPPGATAAHWANDASPELPSTSHLVAVDKDGNAISLTASIETAFGSHVMVRGFLLNNQLTDFSFVPEREGKPVANRVEPNKRPRSSMAPVIVLDKEGAFLLTIGSPGGSRIIPYTAQALIGVLDHGLDVQKAIDRPHVANRNGPTELERLAAWQPWLDAVKPGLEDLGHTVKVGDMNSGLHGILRRADGTLSGGADPRREGVVRAVE
ncbi:MAG: gamma-glutamyltransferase [Myxococcota bacterium]